jgi:hypothetical protein
VGRVPIPTDVSDAGVAARVTTPGTVTKTALDATYAPQSGTGSPEAALTTATGRAIAFAIALG